MFCGERHLVFSTSAREGGTDAKRMGRHPAPSRPVPRADPTPRQGTTTTSVATETELEPAPQGARVGAPQRSKRDHRPAAQRADHGFDAQARTRVS